MRKIPTQWLAGILLFLVIFSCRKPEEEEPLPEPLVYDTLYPLSYLPAYPGSYWKYTDISGELSAIYTGPDYVKASYQASDSSYVPIYDGKPLWGYSVPTNYSSVPQALLSVNVNVNDWQLYYNSGVTTSRRVIARDTTISIGGQDYFPTIVTEDYYVYGSFLHPLNRRYYTKEVGMIREDTYSGADSLSGVRTLSEYFINF